ncbi:MAG TPA: hypothetical protein VK963_03930 [Candidatus Saccharimonadales bacterium]|nr:hypothetical protein [Candidatus Saccharimonadales bacterium]
MKRVYQICVSGAAAGSSVGPAVVLAAAVAREIVQQGHLVLTGATRGLPCAAAMAAKKAGGENISSIGFSPAASRLAHVKKYRLPTDNFDVILYTGFEYTGRNLLLVRSSDAVIMVGGRIGTLNELPIAIEERKPVGVLIGSGGMTAEVERVLKVAQRSRSGIIFDDDPVKLVDKVLALVKLKNRKLGA